jgi:hypothetical protein
MTDDEEERKIFEFEMMLSMDRYIQLVLLLLVSTRQVSRQVQRPFLLEMLFSLL